MFNTIENPTTQNIVDAVNVIGMRTNIIVVALSDLLLENLMSHLQARRIKHHVFR